MSVTMRTEFDNLVNGFKDDGFNQSESELKALDIIARTSQGNSIIQKAIDKAKEIAREERGAIGEEGEVRDVNERIAQIEDKWLDAKSRNSTLARKDLNELQDKGVDVTDAESALDEYTSIERADFDNTEDFSEARSDAWVEFTDSLGNIERLEVTPTLAPTPTVAPETVTGWDTMTSLPKMCLIPTRQRA